MKESSDLLQIGERMLRRICLRFDETYIIVGFFAPVSNLDLLQSDGCPCSDGVHGQISPDGAIRTVPALCSAPPEIIMY